MIVKVYWEGYWIVEFEGVKSGHHLQKRWAMEDARKLKEENNVDTIEVYSADGKLLRTE